MEYHNRPCAANGLVSFRYRGPFGFVMIGAKNAHDAMREAKRSVTGPVYMHYLQVWDMDTYVDVMPCGHPKTSMRSTLNDPECKSTTAYCADCASEVTL